MADVSWSDISTPRRGCMNRDMDGNFRLSTMISIIAKPAPRADRVDMVSSLAGSLVGNLHGEWRICVPPHPCSVQLTTKFLLMRKSLIAFALLDIP